MEQKDLDNIWEITRTIFASDNGMEYLHTLKQVNLYNIENEICYLHTTNNEVKIILEKLKDEIFEALKKVVAIKGINVEDIVIKREIELINKDMFIIEEDDDYTQVGETGLIEEFTMENFVTGLNTEYAYKLCEKVVETIVNNKENNFTPLILFGDSGLGKTHLGQAIGNEILKKCPDKRVKYLTAEGFNNEYLEAIQKGRFKQIRDNRESSGNFRQKYRNLDLIIIDDIQFFERVFGKGEGSVEEEFFNTFNTLYTEKKQIIFISDRSPHNIKNLSNRIMTRIGSGIMQEIKRPDYSTRVAILRKLCEDKHEKINDLYLEYIATNVKNSVREMQGILKNVITTAQLLEKPVDMDMVKDSIEKNIILTNSMITAESIIKKVANYYQITEEDLKSKKRNQEILIPRQVSMYIIKENLDITFDGVGKIFDRDHSTVLNAINKIRNKMEEEATFMLQVKEINRSIRE
ncbi:chromosomal replication initiator protein DnaA [Oceanivirga salmonicida]|uniref:chromosomal replication initiator protein DnaA n=1 Tax=Oceanivirga salmonicida TaxID=1769291 RepID=UPI0008309093|nr:chromosomal replication initiator protein DnaA [Oceanivirga salmonicida]